MAGELLRQVQGGRTGKQTLPEAVHHLIANPRVTLTVLMQFFNAAHTHCETQFRQTRHTDRIGFLPPLAEPSYSLRPGNSAEAPAVHTRGEDRNEVEAVLRIWQLVEETGRAALLWNTIEGPYEVLSEQVVAREAQRTAEAQTRQARAASTEDDQSDWSTDPAGPARSTGAQASVRTLIETERSFETTHGRSAIFRSRGRHLRFERPASVDVEFEDYLIGLIEFVNRESGMAPDRRQAAAAPARQDDTETRPTFGSGIGSAEPDKGPLAGHGRLLLVAGVALVVLMIVLAGIALIRRDAGVGDQPPTAEADPASGTGISVEVVPDR